MGTVAAGEAEIGVRNPRGCLILKLQHGHSFDAEWTSGRRGT
jgi:hypothetical protein